MSLKMKKENAENADATVMTQDDIDSYCAWLSLEEYASATISKYRHELERLCEWLKERPVTRQLLNEWKVSLLGDLTPAAINTMLAAANGFLHFLGRDDCRMKFLKVQRKVFCDKNKELTKEEYESLVAEAKKEGKPRLALTMETLCGLGLRVSELRYITVEVAKAGRAEIQMKGKVRSVLIPNKLARKLLKYAEENNITTGEIFITRSGKSLSRGQIWREMKKLCEKVGVEPDKVFPHNLRHLFARVHYRAHRDISSLADILGHSSIETTRIYLISTGEEHARQIEALGLVS